MTEVSYAEAKDAQEKPNTEDAPNKRLKGEIKCGVESWVS